MGTSRNQSAAGSLWRHAAWPESSSSWSRLSETVSPPRAGRSALSPTEAGTSSTSGTSNPKGLAEELSGGEVIFDGELFLILVSSEQVA
jgi:hypothetical protein